MLDVNSLTQPVEVRKLETVTASDGQVTRKFVSHGTVWVQFKNRRGKAFMAAEQRNSKITHLITMATLEGFNSADWQMIYMGRTLEVESVVVADEVSNEEMDVVLIEAK